MDQRLERDQRAANDADRSDVIENVTDLLALYTPAGARLRADDLAVDLGSGGQLVASARIPVQEVRPAEGRILGS